MDKKEFFNHVIKKVDIIFEDVDNPNQQLLQETVKEIMDYVGYTEFPIRGFNLEKQLGYLVATLDSSIKEKE